MNDVVNNPAHYTDGKYEVIDFIESWGLGFCLGNAVKYISRAGKKDPTKEIEDLEKAIWYINRSIYKSKEVVNRIGMSISDFAEDKKLSEFKEEALYALLHVNVTKDTEPNIRPRIIAINYLKREIENKRQEDKKNG